MQDDFPYDVDGILSVLNHLNIGVYIVDRDRRIVAWNRKATEITGYEAEEVVGRHCRDAVLEHEDKDAHRLCPSDLCPLHRSMALNKESDEPLLVFGNTALGRRIPMSVSVAPLIGPEGNVVGGIEAFRDETESTRDLEFAKRIQRNMLPDTLPPVKGYALEVRYYPHGLVGGDYYDARRLDDGRVSILCADVTGHGVSAALYTMFLGSLQDRHAEAAGDVVNFMSAINGDLSRFVVDESFATGIGLVLDPSTDTVTYCNAGHPKPLLLRADGSREALATHGMPLGIFDEEDYERGEVTLGEGDMILLYTDGATEAPLEGSDMLGEEGLCEITAHELTRGATDLPERIYRRVKRACGDIILPDDVLLLTILRTG